MNCKDCKYYIQDVELNLLTAISIDPEYDDFNIITSANREYLEKNYITEGLYSETHKDFEIKTQHLGHCKAGKIEYGSKFGVTDSLFYFDSEEDLAGYCVGPDFGCIHFENKIASKKKEYNLKKINILPFIEIDCKGECKHFKNLGRLPDESYWLIKSKLYISEIRNFFEKNPDIETIDHVMKCDSCGTFLIGNYPPHSPSYYYKYETS